MMTESEAKELMFILKEHYQLNKDSENEATKNWWPKSLLTHAFSKFFNSIPSN